MSEEEHKGIVKFIHELHELVAVIKKAKENDGKIRFFEKLTIGKELGGVLRALPGVREDIQEFKQMDLADINKFAADLSEEGKHINANLSIADVVDALLCIQGIVRIIERNRK